MCCRTLKLLDRSERLTPQHGAPVFTYDSVYEPKCSTEDVYEQSAKERVLSAMQARP